jgi:hypothetical protein
MAPRVAEFVSQSLHRDRTGDRLIYEYPIGGADRSDFSREFLSDAGADL